MPTQTESDARPQAMDSAAASGESWESRFRGLQRVLQSRTRERDDFAQRVAELEQTARDAEDRYAELAASQEAPEPMLDANNPPRTLREPPKPDRDKSGDELAAELRAMGIPEEWDWHRANG